MEFKYLKEEINNLEWLKRKEELSPYGFEKLKELKEALSICEVSHRRELLINGICKWENVEEKEDIKAVENWVDEHPQLINCG